MPNELTIEVPKPGAVFWESVEHPDNIIILEGDHKSRLLPADKLRAARHKLTVLQFALNEYRLRMLRTLDRQRRALARKRDDDSLKAVIKIDEQIARINSRIFRRVPKPKRRDRIVIQSHAQAKKMQSLAHRIAARIGEHNKALENEAVNKALAAEMQSEISFYANQIIDRWTALGYREEYFIKGKRYLRRIQFEEAHFTEDTIQFKVFVSHLSLLGSTIPHLPDGVRAWDLIKAETLKELEAACECPVTSPHADDGGQGFERGAWVVVHRVGMRDGLFNYVELGTLLAKYNQAMRPKFGVPVGIKQGRIIEYMKLSEVPHFMFNGITGSGKTNIARVALTTWCQFHSPDEIRFVLIDLKQAGDLNAFASIPHVLGGGIVKKISELQALMPRLVALMYDRMRLMSDVNAVGLEAYNAMVPPDQRLPRIVVFVDEAGSIRDLASSKEERDTIHRAMILIATQARAAGIHLGIGTQQPGREVLPTPISNNITYTIMGRQRTTSGAMMSTGSNLVKSIPAIRGRMLVDDGYAYTPVQTPYATDADIARAVAIAKDYPAPRALLLPGADEDTAPIETIDLPPLVPGVTRERVVALSISELGGVMSAQKLYELTDRVTPRATIQKMINGLALQKSVDHEGTTYHVARQGKGYKLIAAQQEAETDE